MLPASSLVRAAGGALVVAILGLEAISARAQEVKPTEAATRQYATAGALQRAEQFALAADEWAKFIKTYPTDPRFNEARHYLGVCQFRNQQYTEAVATFEKLVADAPKFDLLELTYLNLGLAQYNLAKSGQAPMYDRAAQTLAALVTKFPKGEYVPQALYYQGESAYAQGKKVEAAKFYDQLIRQFPKDALAPDAWYALGVTNADLGQYANADTCFAAFLQSFPQHALASEVGVRRGDALLRQGKLDEAEKLFAAGAATPNFPLADYALSQQALSLGEKKQYAQAAALFASLPQKFPQSPYAANAQLSAGRCLYLNGQFAEARAALAKVPANRNDLVPEAAHWIARSFIKEKQPAEALKIVEPLVGKAGDSPFAASLELDRADALYDIPQRQREAIAAYVKLADGRPNDPLAPEALYMAGFTALGLREFDTALLHTQAFLKRYAGNSFAPDVMYVAAESQLLRAKYAEAEQAYAELIAKHAQNPQADAWRVRQSLAMYHQKKYQPATTLLEPIVARLQPPDLAAEANYLLGTSQFELKQYAPAIRSLETALVVSPKWSRGDEVLLALAYAYRVSGKPAECKARLAKLVAEYPSSRQLDRAHYVLGELADAGKDYATAAKEFGEVVAKWPNSQLAPAAMHAQALAQHMLPDNAAAAKTLDALLQKYAASDEAKEARFTRGLVREDLKQFGPAADDFQAYLASNPSGAKKSNARYELARCLAGQNKPAEAADLFRKILAEDPQYAAADQALYELAWTLKSQDKGAEAAAAFEQLAKQYPKSSFVGESLFHVGDFHYQQKDYAKAAKALYEAQGLAGKTPLAEVAQHKLGWAYFRLGDFDSAQKTFQSQRTLYPQGEWTADALFMEGESLFKLGKYKEAVAVYEQVKNPKGKDFQTLARLHAAQALGQLKDWSRSLEALERLAKDDPQSAYLPEILCEQGWAQQNLGRTNEALALYESVTAKSEAEVAARARFLIGEIYFERKDHAEAVRNFFKVAYGYVAPQWQAAAQYEAGRCFEVLGKKAQARQAYEEVVNKYPTSDKLGLARERLAALGK